MKVSAPKTEWQISAEKEFLAMRDQLPQGALLHHLTPDDTRNLSPEMQKCLTLRCASEMQKSKWRMHQWMKKFQRRPFDCNSPAVKIALLTEKILRVRAHLLKWPKKQGHHVAKKALSVRISLRQRVMKSLYKSDYPLYRHVCTELGIRCIRFAIPTTKDPQYKINPQAVDGDRARFLIRQRMYEAKHRPREMKRPDTNQLIRYTRHPIEPVPASHGKPQPTPQQVSRAWPYGVRADRVAGKQVVYNPTAAGLGFWPARGTTVGGPVSRDRATK